MNPSKIIFELNETIVSSQTEAIFLYKKLSKAEEQVKLLQDKLNLLTDTVYNTFQKSVPNPLSPHRIASLAEKKKRNQIALRKLQTWMGTLSGQIEKQKAREANLYRTLKGYPSESTLESLRCPLSKKPLIDAIRLPNGTVVSAASLGLKIQDKKLKMNETPETVRDRFNAPEISRLISENTSIPSPIGDFFFENPTSFEHFCKKLKVDYKICELAESFVSEGDIVLKPLLREFLEDPVTSDLYVLPMVVSCGHTLSQTHYEKESACYCRAEITSKTPNTILEIFIRDYQLLNPRKILEFRLEEIEEKLNHIEPTRRSLIKEEEELQKAIDYYTLVEAIKRTGACLPFVFDNAEVLLCDAHYNVLQTTETLEELEREKPSLEKEQVEIKNRLVALSEEPQEESFEAANAKLKNSQKKIVEAKERLEKAQAREAQRKKNIAALTKRIKKLSQSSPNQNYDHCQFAVDEFAKGYDLLKVAKKELQQLLTQYQEANACADAKQKELLTLLEQLTVSSS